MKFRRIFNQLKQQRGEQKMSKLIKKYFNRKEKGKQIIDDIDQLTDEEKIHKYPDQFYWEYKID